MNLYFIYTNNNTVDYVVLAADKEKALQIFNYKTKKIATKAERVKQGHYFVGVTYLFDDIS